MEAFTSTSGLSVRRTQFVLTLASALGQTRARGTSPVILQTTDFTIGNHQTEALVCNIQESCPSALTIENDGCRAFVGIL